MDKQNKRDPLRKLSEEQEASIRARVATGDGQEAIAAELRAQKPDAKLNAERLSRQIEREAEDVDRWLESIARIVRSFLDG